MTALQQRRSAAGEDKSTQAQAELFHQYQDQLRAFLLGLLRDRAAADDCLQDVFLKLVETWETIELGSVRGWLFTVAYHQALAQRRRRKVQDAALAELWARPVWQASPTLSDEQVIQSESVEAVRRAVQALPLAQREVVERRMHRNQTFAAIAAELDCPLGTVLTRMRLALKTLAKMLKE